MKLSDVQEVQEVSSATNANILLGQGWKLLAIHPSRHPRRSIIYVLGARTIVHNQPISLPPDPPMV